MSKYDEMTPVQLDRDHEPVLPERRIYTGNVVVTLTPRDARRLADILRDPL